MTSIPHNRHQHDAGDGDRGGAPADVAKTIKAWWPIVVTLVTLVSGVAVSFNTFAGHTARIDQLEKRQQASDDKIDNRLHIVETGVTTLLERTKPRP